MREVAATTGGAGLTCNRVDAVPILANLHVKGAAPVCSADPNSAIRRHQLIENRYSDGALRPTPAMGRALFSRDGPALTGPFAFNNH